MKKTIMKEKRIGQLSKGCIIVITMTRLQTSGPVYR